MFPAIRSLQELSIESCRLGENTSAIKKINCFSRNQAKKTEQLRFRSKKLRRTQPYDERKAA